MALLRNGLGLLGGRGWSRSPPTATPGKQQIQQSRHPAEGLSGTLACGQGRKAEREEPTV